MRLKNNSSALSKSIQKYSDCFEQLTELYSDVGFDEFTELYNSIRDLTQLYSDGIVEQSKWMKRHLQHEFKYRFFESDSYKELGKLRSEVEYTYNKWSKDLNYKKDKLWSYKDYNDFSKWNLQPDDLEKIDELIKDEDDAKSKMLPRETEFVLNKRYLLNYIENQCVKEIRRCSKLQWKSIKNNFINVSQEQCKILNKIHVYWADFSVKFTTGV